MAKLDCMVKEVGRIAWYLQPVQVGTLATAMLDYISVWYRVVPVDATLHGWVATW